jgi:hypothetical protein
MMLPGILTIEAPQAYRTIGAVPVVFLLIALALQVISRSAAHVGRKPRTGPLLALAFTALAFAAAAENVVTYFVLQVRDRGAWMAFEADYQEVARIIRDEANGFRVWVDPIYYDYPTVRIPLGGQLRYNRFLLSDHLPVPRIPGPGQPPGDLYVLDGYQMDLVPLFRRAFPQASFRLHIDPFGRVMLVSIAVPWPAGARRPDSALANRGLLGAFYSNDSWSGKPVLFRYDPAVSFHFHWDGDGLPGHFTADWTARLHVEQGGEYEFGLVSSDPGYLLIDGAVVVAQGHREDTDVVRGKIRLKPGDHLLVVRYQRGSFASALRCWWQPPGSGHLSVIPLDNLTPLTKQEYETTRVTLPIPVHTTGD